MSPRFFHDISDEKKILGVSLHIEISIIIINTKGVEREHEKNVPKTDQLKT